MWDGRFYFNDVKRLLYGSFGIEGESGVDFRGDLSGNNLEDFLSEFNQQTVKGGIDFVVKILAL